MRQEPIVYGAITGAVRSRSRRTAIVQAQYKQALRAAYPSIAEFETAVYQLSTPRRAYLPATADATQIASREQRYINQSEEWLDRVTAVRAQHPLGAKYTDAANTVSALLSRVNALSNAPFYVDASGYFPDLEVVKALENWLDQDDENFNFWNALQVAIDALDRPLTGTEEAPPETLTEAEKENPLSVAPANPTSGI